MIYKILKKVNFLFIMLAVGAGIFLLCGGAALNFRVAKNVTVDGVEVGGLKYEVAAKMLREQIIENLKQKSLTVTAGESKYVFTYPEINFKDNLFTLLKDAKKGDELTAQISCYLCGMDEIARDICRSESVLKVEPYARFSSHGAPFTYFEGNDGRMANFEKLCGDITKSLAGNFSPVTVAYDGVPRSKTLDTVKRETLLLNSFSTYFDDTNINRTSNIRLAAAKLNGTVLESGKTLSFNDIVGDRVKERGFLPAKIIEKGEFIEGVGGGVCQVSTTLYNAALLSGLKIEEYHPHSLAVGYVSPSRDAMVSGKYFDLKIKNTFETPIYIRANVQKGSVTFSIYGLGDGATYELVSRITGSIPAQTEETSDPLKVKEGKDGIVSEGYLCVERDGVKRDVLIRRDKYAPIKGVTLSPELQNSFARKFSCVFKPLVL